MNPFIYFLLLCVWTKVQSDILNKNISNGFNTTSGPTRAEPVTIKMDSFKRHLLVVAIGLVILGFVFSCFCFLHYNCMTDEVPKGGMVKKDGIASSSSRLLSPQSQVPGACNPETQCLLPDLDKLSKFPTLERLTLPPSSKEKLIWLSLDNPLLISSAEMFNNVFNLEKPPKPEKEAIACHLHKGHREKSHKPTRARKSSHARKSASSPYPKKGYRATHSSSGQYSSKSTKSQGWPFAASKLQKWTKLPMKKSGKYPETTKPCRCYKEKCLVCSLSEPLLNDSPDVVKTKTQTSLFLSEVKSFSGSFYTVDCGESVPPYYDISDSDMMPLETIGDSDKEITIICKVDRDAVTHKRSKRKERRRKGKKGL